MSAKPKRMYYKRTPRLNQLQRKEVRALVREPMELKYNEDLRTDSFPSTTAGGIFQLSIIPQGDTVTQRSGDQLMLKSLTIQGDVSVADGTNKVRFIVFQWRPITTPTIADILSAGVVAGTVDVYSLYNFEKRSQYKILYDKRWVLMGNATSNYPITPASIINFKTVITKKLLKKLQYVSNSNSVGHNQVWYLTLSDSAASYNPEISFVPRFEYYDA